MPTEEELEARYVEWADSDAHVYESDHYGHERAAFYAGAAAMATPEPGPAEQDGILGSGPSAGPVKPVPTERQIVCKSCGSRIDTRSWTQCCGSPA